MSMNIKKHNNPERRKYLRLDTVFPVQFHLVALEGKQQLSDELQGFTNNICKAGLCLVINNLNPTLAKMIKEEKTKFSLNIDLPAVAKPIPALARVAWIKEVSTCPNKYLIGLNYELIEQKQANKIMFYARARKIFVPLALSVIILLVLGIAVNNLLNIKLAESNRILIRKLVKTIQESGIAKQKIIQIAKQSEDLQSKIQHLQSGIQAAEEERESLLRTAKLRESSSLNKIAELNKLVQKLKQDKVLSQEQLQGLRNQEAIISEELASLEKDKSTLEKANLGKMYEWLKIHQNPRTGLAMSFEGDSDIANWAFIYDQSLVAQAYTYFGDFDRAKKILNFFDQKAKRSPEGLFYNAYYVFDGEPTEYMVHSGPNIWLGIAILQYSKRANNTQYLKLAEEIAAVLIKFQNQDQEGFIRGGPEVTWVATEHNLDAYAFFNMLYNITGNNLYLSARDKVLNWLIQHTYDNKDVPIKRGRGDSTIATDTYAWSLAAIGPEKLEESGLDPDIIMEFAQENCSVEVNYTRPEGKTIKIKGFDFAAQRNLSRGGVISGEWTAQMVVAFRIMADFYRKKGTHSKVLTYEAKANEYMTQLGKMVISSPSPSGQGESCLPYATQDFVDTGHGWMTPKGKSTGSLSATTYTIFAYYNYNPLELK